MPEPSFEAQLASLYRETPPSLDDEAFLARVDAELTRHLRRRRIVLGSLGGMGAAVSMAAIMRLEAAAGSRELVGSALHSLASLEWGFATTALLIASLLAPALMRTLIDPK